MSQYNMILLDECISQLGNALGKASAGTWKVFNRVTEELREFAGNNEGPMDRLLIEFYESRFKVPAFTRPAMGLADRRMAGMTINIHRILNCQDYASRIKFFHHSQSVLWWIAVLDEFEEWLKERNYSEVSIETRRKHMRAFFTFLDSKGCTNLEELENDDFISYLTYMEEKKYRLSSRSSMLSSLRVFISSPVGKQHLKCNPMPLLVKLRLPHHDRLPSVYTPDEIRQIIGQIDRTTKQGKLLYAVVLLAAVYGLRNSDITNLKFENIRWNENEICFIQHKTRKPVRLPLTQEVRYAILDYVENARADSPLDIIFIRQKAPHSKYSTISTAVRRLLEKCGIETGERHSGIHALRHSLATSLHAMDTPLCQISSVLGHSTAMSTMTYIWSDVEHLRIVAEEVPIC